MVDRRYRFSPVTHGRHCDRIVGSAETAGAIMKRAGRYTGATVELDDRALRNFGSCGYLGLELRPELRRGAAEAAEQYGTQLPYSRAYVEHPLYQELEASLRAMTGRPVVVAPSTTLAISPPCRCWFATATRC